MDSTSVIHMMMKESVTAVLAKVKTAFVATNAGVATSSVKAGGALNSMNTGVVALGGNLSALRLGLGAFAVYMGGSMLKSIAKVGGEFELLELRMKTIFGKDNSASAMKWLENFTNKNAQGTIKEYADLFTKLQGSGFGDAKGVMQDMVDISVAFGLSAFETTGVIRGLLDMMGKGTAQAEEFKKQIGQRVPGAVKKIAEEMGMNMKEFMKAAEMGTISAEQFIKSFQRVIKRDYGGISAEFQNSWQAATGRLSNAWTFLMKDMSDLGVLNSFKASVDLITKSVVGLSSTLRWFKGNDADASQSDKILAQFLRPGEDDPVMIDIAEKRARREEQILKDMKRMKEEQEESRKSSLVNGFGRHIESWLGPNVQAARNRLYDYKPIKQKDMLTEEQRRTLAENKYDTLNARIVGKLEDVAVSAKGGIFAEMMMGAEDATKKFTKEAEVWKSIGSDVAKSMSSTFNTFFVDVIEGRMKSFSDYMLSFLKDIATALSKLLSEMLIQGAISGIRNTFMTAPDATTTTTPTKGLPKAMRVEVINQSGQPVQGQAKTSRDADGMVLSIVLDAISRDKAGMRTAIKGVR